MNKKIVLKELLNFCNGSAGLRKEVKLNFLTIVRKINYRPHTEKWNDNDYANFHNLLVDKLHYYEDYALCGSDIRRPQNTIVSHYNRKKIGIMR